MKEIIYKTKEKGRLEGGSSKIVARHASDVNYYYIQTTPESFCRFFRSVDIVFIVVICVL